MITISKFYITTPIYYANDKLHLGHANSNVIADVLARWHRLIGDDVFFVTGSDEHGEKIEKAAVAAGMQNIDFVDYEVKKFKELWQRLNISNDRFIRTTEHAHEEAVKAFVELLNKNQDIYKAKYSGGMKIRQNYFLPKPIKPGDELEVEIEAVASQGDGIAKKDGFVIFIKGAKVGEKVKIRVTEVKARFGIGEIVQ